MDIVLRLVVGAAAVGLALLLARWWRSRQPVDAPTQRRSALPDQVDRADFASPLVDWLVVIFTSDTCSSCADVSAKAAALASDQVVVQNVSYQSNRALHDRYRIDSVPSVLIIDSAGVVVRAVVGPVTATDLWAAVAEARDPGSIERGQCDGH